MRIIVALKCSKYTFKFLSDTPFEEQNSSMFLGTLNVRSYFIQFTKALFVGSYYAWLMANVSAKNCVTKYVTPFSDTMLGTDINYLTSAILAY